MAERPRVLCKLLDKGYQFGLTSLARVLGVPRSYQFSGYIAGGSPTLAYDQIRIAFATLIDMMAVNTPFREGNRLIMHKFIVTTISWEGKDSHMQAQYVRGEVSLRKVYFLDLIKSSRNLFAKSECPL